MKIEDQIKLIKDNYEAIFSDLKKFDSHQDFYDKSKTVPQYYQVGTRLFDICNNQERTHYCSDISGLIQQFLLKHKIRVKIVYGKYVGKGTKNNQGLWDGDEEREHAWIELKDGTIIDGSFRQFQKENAKTKDLKFINIVRPGEKGYKDYEKESWKTYPELTPLVVAAMKRPYNERNNVWWNRSRRERKKVLASLGQK